MGRGDANHFACDVGRFLVQRNAVACPSVVELFVLFLGILESLGAMARVPPRGSWIK